MTLEARRFILTGRVQGVGYRPFVYNRAVELGLRGTVLNGAGMIITVGATSVATYAAIIKWSRLTSLLRGHDA